MTVQDNDRGEPASPASPLDAHGQAALLLVESLIHGLCEAATLSSKGAIEIAERAADVQLAQIDESRGETSSMWRSHTLLSSIVASLRLDDPDGPPTPRLI